MFRMKRIATVAVITAAAIVPAVGAHAANASNVDAPDRDASIASLNMQMPNSKHADLMTLETFDDVGFSDEPLGWQWTDMSG
jgi:hypothetical protein